MAETGTLTASGPRTRRVPAPLLALLSGPLSFGITAPTLILGDAAADLGVSASAATWIVTAFGWGIAVGTPLLAGLLGHRGVRATLIACGVLVLTGAVLVVAVPVLPVLVLGSALQALGTAGLTVTAMDLADSPRAMGVVTATLAGVGATGLIIGSVVRDLLSWQAALALPVVSLLAIPAVAKRAPGGGRPAASGRFDPTGAALLTTLVTALVFLPHHPAVAGPGAAVALVLLGLHLRVRPAGFVPRAVVRTPRFGVAAGLALVLAVINFGVVYALPALLARHTEWTPGQIGTAMLWPLLLGGTLSWFVVAASARVPFPVVVAVLAALGVAAPAVVALAAGAPVLLAAMFAGSLTASSGQGVLAVRASAAVPAEHRAAALGLFNLCYLLGAAFGPAIVALLAI
ncbi:MFS transporter [Amycolatopsis anabasis]|uniref:MFS transporter n=1 Tax=Amycolatopsis anabasis TaxID=1840409 RepID=UPI00131C0F06|nr:MFS transporter [Amycolatopsis anabasis]